MNLDSKYIIDSRKANEIRNSYTKIENKSLLTGKTTFMNVLWALIMIIVGVVFLIMGTENWTGSVGNYIGVTLGPIFIIIGSYMLKNKKSNFVMIKDGFLTINPATDNRFHIPIESIKNMGIKDDKNRITDWSDIGANSAKSAANEYKLFIKTDEIDDIDISFDFSGIRMTDLLCFLSENNLIQKHYR